MSEDFQAEIIKIVSKYKDTASALYSTLIFYNSAIIYAHEKKYDELLGDYLELENDLKKLFKGNENEFFDKMIRRHMNCMCFISLVSSFEEFLVDICILAIKKHPHKISGEKVDFKKALELSREELIEFKAKEYLNKIMYMSPKDYLKSLCELLSLDQSTLNEDFIKYIEIKARRDLGVHSDWKKNETYERKVKESGGTTPEDDDFLRPSRNYFAYSSYVCNNLIAKITNQSCNKLFKVNCGKFKVLEIPEIT